MGGGALLFKDKDALMAASLFEGLPVRTVVCNPTWHLKRALFHTLMGRFLYGIMQRIPMLHLGETRFHPLGDITRLAIPPGLILNGISAFERSKMISQELQENLSFLAEQGWVLLPNEQGGEPRAERQRINKALRFAMLAPDRTQRDSALSALQGAAIGANELYGVILPMVEGVDNHLEPSPGNYPNARSFAERLITLPCHNDVTLADIRTMAGVLKG